MSQYERIGQTHPELPNDHSPILARARKHHTIGTPLDSPHLIGMVREDVRGDRWELARCALMVGVER
jgi:hypothetical protein